MTDLITSMSLGKPKMPFKLPGSLSLARLNPIPHKSRSSSRKEYEGLPLDDRPRRRRRKSGSRRPLEGPQPVAALQRSFNPLDGIRTLRSRKWSWLDLQHLVTIAFIAFSFGISPIPWCVYIPVTALYTTLVLMPATRQFFAPSLPIWTYLLYFFSSRFIPNELRPHIWVKVLPALENVLYGANISNILSAHTHTALDILAWIPYGIGHFSAPLFTSVAIFWFAPPGSTPLFARAFGYMNCAGVTLQLLFPCTPPWYERDHPTLEPAVYGMPGSPAGLARIDKLLGKDMYTTSFTTAPVPFGAFPSLHAASAVLEALFLVRCFPRLRGFFYGYVAWILWATMYLNHHYAVDLVGGALLAAFAYRVAVPRWMPRRQEGKRNRWEYEYVEVGNDEDADSDVREKGDEESGFSFRSSSSTAVHSRSGSWRGSEDGGPYAWSDRETGESSYASSSGSNTHNPATPSHGPGEFERFGVVGGAHQHQLWGGDGARSSFDRGCTLSEVVVR